MPCKTRPAFDLAWSMEGGRIEAMWWAAHERKLPHVRHRIESPSTMTFDLSIILESKSRHWQVVMMELVVLDDFMGPREFGRTLWHSPRWRTASTV